MLYFIEYGFMEKKSDRFIFCSNTATLTNFVIHVTKFAAWEDESLIFVLI